MKYLVDVGGQSIEVSVDGGVVSIDGKPAGDVTITEIPGTPVVLLSMGGLVHRLVIGRTPDPGRYDILTDSSRLDVSALDERTQSIRRLTASRVSKRDQSLLTAPMPGLILRVEVEPGQTVRAGQGLVVMEAMKMENELRAVTGGTVKAVHVQAGMTVEKGASLVELNSPASVDSA